MWMNVTTVNWLAVLVAAFATFMIGGLWYGALFAKAWLAIHGFSEEVQAEMQKRQFRNFGIFFAGDLVMGVVISLLLAGLGANGAVAGAVTGFVLWLGISATIGASKNAAYNKPLPAYMIDTTHELVCLVAIGAILGAWR